MFIGQYRHNLDEKNRLIIPAKFRSMLGDNAVMTIGNDQCIAIYAQSEWNKLQEKLLTYNSNSSDARKQIRMIAGNATEANCDSQGRVILPQNLLEHSDIIKEIVLVGNLNHIEIWAKEKWEKYYDFASKNFDETSEKLL